METQGFDFFDGTTTKHSTPRITLRKGGLLVLTPAAVAMLGQGVEHVQVGFNAKTREIGIRQAPEDARGRYRLQSQRSSRCQLIGTRRFFRHYGIQIDKAQTFEVREVGNGLISFPLPEEGQETNGGEAKGDTPKPKTTSRRRKAPTSKK